MFWFNCRALLDMGSPLSFIHQGASVQRVATGASDVSYVRLTTPKSWSGFGSRELLSTHRRTRMIIQFYHDGQHPRFLRYRCSLSLMRQFDILSCVAKTARCAFSRASHFAPEKFVRLDAPALTSLYRVDIIPAYDGSKPSNRFVSSG